MKKPWNHLRISTSISQYHNKPHINKKKRKSIISEKKKVNKRRRRNRKILLLKKNQAGTQTLNRPYHDVITSPFDSNDLHNHLLSFTLPIKELKS
jgi:hypothetical protein